MNKKIAVIGGGINGLCSAWLCAQQGLDVSVYEKGSLMSQTSRSSSKLLHGGLRYLEFLQFSLVKESLQERKFWLEKVPELTNQVELVIPIYKNGSRQRYEYKLGLMLYDFLAGKNNLGKHRYLSKDEVENIFPNLNKEGLTGAYAYFDGQMDDYALGLWVAEQFKTLGGKIYENTEVEYITNDGQLTLKPSTASNINKIEREKTEKNFDCIVNACGPWAKDLVSRSDLNSEINLKLVRGTHIIIPNISDKALYLEDKESKRLFFVLPYQGNTLVGTTERDQYISDKIEPSDQEIEYLLKALNGNFSTITTRKDILKSFAGARPLIFERSKGMNEVSREYKIKVNHKLINVFGGKWTTSRKLGESVLAETLKIISK